MLQRVGRAGTVPGVSRFVSVTTEAAVTPAPATVHAHRAGWVLPAARRTVSVAPHGFK